MKIAETSYTHLQIVLFISVLSLSCNFRNMFSRGEYLKSVKQLKEKNHPCITLYGPLKMNFTHTHILSSQTFTTSEQILIPTDPADECGIHVSSDQFLDKTFFVYFKLQKQIQRRKKQFEITCILI